MTVIEFPKESKNRRIQIAFDGKVAVTIWPDGVVSFGDGYTPDEAAKAFWASVGYFHPNLTAAKGDDDFDPEASNCN